MAKPLSTRRRSGASSRGDGGAAGSPFPERREETISKTTRGGGLARFLRPFPEAIEDARFCEGPVLGYLPARSGGS